MWAEKHPEKGSYTGSSYTQSAVTYSGFDARGHATEKADGPFDLTFQFDAAERLLKVLNTGNTTTPIKTFTYADTNGTNTDGTTNYTKGKLTTAVRNNVLPSPTGTVTVTDTYTYSNPGGALSQRNTNVAFAGTSQTFSESITTDKLGQLTTLTYPTCVTACNGTGAIASVPLTYSNGFLTGVTGYATLAYHANGALNTVKHGTNNGVDVVDTYDRDDHWMMRPKNITFSGYDVCPSPSTPAITPAATSVCAGSSSSASIAPQSGATYAWTVNGGTLTGASTGTSINFTAGTGPSLQLTVTATNSCGSVSATTTVTINPATVITSQPQDATIAPGGTATLTVAAGGATLQYQWYNGSGTASPISGATGAQYTAAPSGTSSYWVRVTGSCGTADSRLATVYVNLPAPTGLTATTQTNTSQVSVSWNPVAGAGGYQVYYATNITAQFQPLGGIVAGPPATFTMSTGSATVAYLFRVTAADASMHVSANQSNIDYAVMATQLFTDERLVAGATEVRARHVVELRNAIDALRMAVGLPTVWAGAPAPSGEITADVFASLLDPFSAARGQPGLGLPPFGYTGGVATPAKGNTILAAHVQQLRDALR
jgi:hypothetical protein